LEFIPLNVQCPFSGDWGETRSAIHPGEPKGTIFNSAALVLGDSGAPKITPQGHISDDGGPDNVIKVSAVSNDSSSIPKTGKQIGSSMSIRVLQRIRPTKGDQVRRYRVSDDGNSLTPANKYRQVAESRQRQPLPSVGHAADGDVAPNYSEREFWRHRSSEQSKNYRDNENQQKASSTAVVFLILYQNDRVFSKSISLLWWIS
jgi:hypothetical protein